MSKILTQTEFILIVFHGKIDIYEPKIAKIFAPSARFPIVKHVFIDPKSEFFRAFGAISPCKIAIYELQIEKNRAAGAKKIRF